MASLNSDDVETPSSVELTCGDRREFGDGEQAEVWQNVCLNLNTVRVQILSSGDEGFTLCRRPVDEPAKLVRELAQLLSREREVVSFEPQEPSFELNFQRTHHGGIKVEAWIDSGNAQTGFYRWDAAGIRFFTSAELMLSFVNELKKEFSLND